MVPEWSRFTQIRYMRPLHGGGAVVDWVRAAGWDAHFQVNPVVPLLHALHSPWLLFYFLFHDLIFLDAYKS